MNVAIIVCFLSSTLGGSQQPSEETYRKLGMARNLFPPLPGNDPDVRYWRSVAEGGTTVLYPAGRADRRYFLNPVDGLGGRQRAVLSCHAFRNGKASLVWKLSLGPITKNPTMPVTNGTLSKYLSRRHRLPMKIPAAARADLNSQTGFAGYEYQPMAGSLYSLFIFADGTASSPETTDQHALMPDLIGWIAKVDPLNITALERAYIAKHGTEITIPPKLPEPPKYPTKARPTPLGTARARFLQLLDEPGTKNWWEMSDGSPDVFFPAGMSDVVYVGGLGANTSLSKHKMINGKPKRLWTVVFKDRYQDTPPDPKVLGTLARCITRNQAYPRHASAEVRRDLLEVRAYAVYQELDWDNSTYLQATFLNPDGKYELDRRLLIYDGFGPLAEWYETLTLFRGKADPLPITATELRYLARTKMKAR